MTEHRHRHADREAKGTVQAPRAAAHKPAAECGCRLAAVRRDLGRALRVLAELEARLPSDADLATASLTPTEAERLDRYCLNVKVSLDELRRWSGLLTGAAESLAGRSRPPGDA